MVPVHDGTHTLDRTGQKMAAAMFLPYYIPHQGERNLEEYET